MLIITTLLPRSATLHKLCQWCSINIKNRVLNLNSCLIYYILTIGTTIVYPPTYPADVRSEQNGRFSGVGFTGSPGVHGLSGDRQVTPQVSFSCFSEAGDKIIFCISCANGEHIIV